MSGVLNFMLGILGISVAVGSIAGTEITFTATPGINGGTAGTTVTEVAALLCNNSHSSYDTANIIDLKGAPAGGSILGTGANGPGSYRVTFGVTLNQPTKSQVLVFYRKQVLHL
jgi:hypothetical protein